MSHKSEWTAWALGAVAVLFFGGMGLFMVWKLDRIDVHTTTHEIPSKVDLHMADGCITLNIICYEGGPVVGTETYCKRENETHRSEEHTSELQSQR